MAIKYVGRVEGKPEVGIGFEMDRAARRAHYKILNGSWRSLPDGNINNSEEAIRAVTDYFLKTPLIGRRLYEKK